MKYAIVGCGTIARHHINAAIENGLDIVALCDLKRQKAATYIHKYEELQKARIYDDYSEMFDVEEIDILSIATDSGKHAQIAIAAIDKGIHILIEKPLALSIRDANKIIKKADEKKVKVEVCFQNRFNPLIQNLRTALKKGRFGKITHGSVHIRWNRNAEYYAKGTWRGTWKEDGGVLMNQCIHGIDLLLWMMGDNIRSVYGEIRNLNHDYIEAEDLGMAVISFENGTIATIEGTSNTYTEASEGCLCLYGLKGAVKMGGQSINTIEEWKFESMDPEDNHIVLRDKIDNVYGNSHPRALKDLAEAIRYNRPTYISLEDGKKALSVILAIYKSAKEHRPIDFPLEEFSTEDMEGYFDKGAKQ